MRFLTLKSRLKPALPYVFLFIEVLVFYRQVLFSSDYHVPFDLGSFHLPMAWFTVDSLAMHRLPLWDPYTYCGFPFYANIQAQLFYPLAWPVYGLQCLLKGDLLFKLLEWQTALHVFLGGALAFLLLRRLNVSRGAALFGATIFQLGGFFSSQTQHLGMICCMAWMPLAWLCILELGRRFSWRWLAGLGCALAMSLLAGFPAAAIVVLGSGFVLALLLIVFRHAPTRLFVWTAGACAWALLLSAVQLIPTANLVRASTASLRGQWHLSGGVPLQALVSLVSPDHYHVFDPTLFKLPYNATFLYLYCGIPGLALAIAAAFFSRHKLRGVAVAITLLCLIWTLCSYTPLIGHFYGALPEAIRGPMYPELAMAAFVLGMALLGALGAERFVAPLGRLAIAALVLVAAADLTGYGSGRYMNTTTASLDPGVSPVQFQGSKEVVTRLREFTGQSFPRARFDIVKDSKEWACSAPILHLPTANGEQPLALLRILKLRLAFTNGLEHERFYEVSRYDSRLLDLLNVRYLLEYSFLGPPVAGAHIERLENAGPHILYENTDALPRFFLVNRVRRTRDLKESLKAVSSPDFDPAREAVVEGDGELTVPLAAEPAGRVKATQYAPAKVTLSVDAKEPAFLVSSETFYPGWRARVNGRKERIWMTNGAFRGLPVPAGHSEITMTFLPSDLIYGALLSVLGCALLGGVICREVRGSRQRRTA